MSGCTCESEWHSQVYKVTPSFHIEGCIWYSVLVHLDCVVACFQVNDTDPSFPSYCLLLHLEVTTWEGHYLCCCIDCMECLADLPLLGWCHWFIIRVFCC